jgi:hypothetical protein
MRRSIQTIFLAAVATALLGSSAAMAKPSIAILGLEVKDSGGNIDEQTTKVATQLTDALRARARQPNGPYKLAPNSDKDLLEVKLLNGCDEGAQCMSAIGKELRAQRLLYGRITKRKDGYQVSLDLLDVSKRSMERSTSELIPFDDANAAGLKNWGRSLYNRLTGVPEEGVLVIEANVDKGTVYVDGEVKTTLKGGKATISGLSEGPHTVGVEAEGHDAYAGEIDVRAGETVSVEVQMAAKGVTGPTPGGGSKTGRPGGASRALFWTSLVLTGAGAAAVTVTGLQVRGSLKDDQLAAINALANRPDDPIRLSKDNACGDAASRDQSDPDVAAVIDACDAGKSRAQLTNIFLGASIVTAAAASYFYYRGYIAAGSGSRERTAGKRSKRRNKTVRVIPSVGPGHVGAGVAIEF